MIYLYTCFGRFGSFIQVFAESEEKAREIMVKNDEQGIYDPDYELEKDEVKPGFVMLGYGEI